MASYGNPAGTDGDPAQGVSLTLETSVDLHGNASPERLVANGRTLAVGNGRPDKQRIWPLEEIDGFRIQPTVGSCFLQGRIKGDWVDLLRRPGNADPQLADATERLNARGYRQPATTSNMTPRFGETDGSAPPDRGPKVMHLGFLLRPFHGSIALLLFLSIVVVGIELVPPQLMRVLVDRVLKGGEIAPPSAQLFLLLFAIVASLLLVRLAGTLITVWKGYVSSHVGTAMTADLRDALVEKLNSLPLAFHDRNQVGVLMSQVAYDTETLHTLIYHMTSGLLLQSLQVVGISVAMFFLNAKLAMITLLPVPLILAGSWYFTRYLQPRQHHYWEAVGKQASALMGMLSGIRVIKSFVQEEQEIRQFRQSSRRLRNSRRTVDVSTSTFTSAMGLLFAVGGLAVWYVGGCDVLDGRMTLGSLMAFIQYLAMFYTPLTSIAESTSWFANFFGTSRRICDVLAVPSEPRSPPSAVPLERARGQLEVEHLTFGYDKSRPVLKDVSFAVHPGQMLGIVGRSGSGKSTLISLLGRLYEADSGRVRIDGVDVRQMSPQNLRRQIGMVPQDPYLFRGSVAENVAYGNPQAEPEQILLAAVQADAHDFVMQMPLAYSSQLREGGQGLSGGQRQRLSIARALLFDPPILILDEATSNIDAESENAICKTLRQWTRRRTAIVVSHRLSTLRDADRLLVFEDGRLVEQGSPQELLAQGGPYSRLANLQWGLADLRRRLGVPVGAAIPSDADAFQGDDEAGVGSPHVDHDPGDTFGGDDPSIGAVGAQIVWLEPDHTTIEPGVQGDLCVTADGDRFEGAYALRALPTVFPERFISLRCRDTSGRDREVGILRALDDWPPAAQEAVRVSLKRRYLLRYVQEIRQMRTRENLLALSVTTDSGPATIRLDKPGEGSQPFGPNGLLLIDAAGNCFVIADRDALPKRQRQLLTLYFGD
jgi:ATP-binding cassette subfamily B protein